MTGKYSDSNRWRCIMLYCGCSNCGGSRPIVLAIQHASTSCAADHSLVPQAVAWPLRTSWLMPRTTVSVGVYGSGLWQKTRSTYSSWSRWSEAARPSRRCLVDRPTSLTPSPPQKILVVSTRSDRRQSTGSSACSSLIAEPMISSAAPTGTPYVSALSNRLTPALRAMRKQVLHTSTPSLPMRSSFAPYVALVPYESTLTARPVLPSIRYGIFAVDSSDISTVPPWTECATREETVLSPARGTRAAHVAVKTTSIGEGVPRRSRRENSADD